MKTTFNNFYHLNGKIHCRWQETIDGDLHRIQEMFYNDGRIMAVQNFNKSINHGPKLTFIYGNKN